MAPNTLLQPAQQKRMPSTWIGAVGSGKPQ
jgi:hypothetical protein